MSDPKWFVLNVRPNRESAVAAHLEAKGYYTFVPAYRRRRVWSDRIKVIDLPLFPTYVFCQFDPSVRMASVVTTPGFLRILGCGSTPAPVDEMEIRAIRRIVESRLPTGPWPYMGAGTKVRIDAGPLAGLEGTVVQLKSELQLIVSVCLLQRSVAVQILPSWVTVLGGPVARTCTVSQLQS